MRGLIKALVVGCLAILARCHLRKQRHLTFIAVGGSSGKTSTVAAIVAALSTTHRVRTGTGLNTDTGVPLGILGVRIGGYGPLGWAAALLRGFWNLLADWDAYDVYVAEYGIDHPGDMAALIRIRVPDIAVMTSVALEHAGYFSGSLEEVLAQIADEEMQLLTALPEKAVAVVNVDDARIAARLDGVDARIVAVGAHHDASYELTRYRVGVDGTEIEAYCHGVTYPVFVPHAVSRASAISLVLAAAAAHQAGAPLKEAFLAISKAWRVPAGRGVLLRGSHGRLLVDSSYNATPMAVSDALRMLDDVSRGRRRVAILGDMRELGEHAAQSHADLAPDVAGAADLAILVGPEMATHLMPALEERHVPVVSFATVSELLAEIETVLEPEDAVLIKGSQNTLFLERVTERLLAEKGDRRLLPRRGARWDRIRAATA